MFSVVVRLAIVADSLSQRASRLAELRPLPTGSAEEEERGTGHHQQEKFRDNFVPVFCFQCVASHCVAGRGRVKILTLLGPVCIQADGTFQ